MTRASAQPPQLKYAITCADPADPKTCVQALIKGESAPFDGQLIHEQAAIDLAIEVLIAPRQAAIDVSNVKAVASIELASQEKISAIKQDALKSEVEHWKMRAIAAEDIEIYEKPLFVAAASAAATLILVLLIKP